MIKTINKTRKLKKNNFKISIVNNNKIFSFNFPTVSIILALNCCECFPLNESNKSSCRNIIEKDNCYLQFYLPLPHDFFKSSLSFFLFFAVISTL